MDGVTFNVVKNPETEQLSVSGRITKIANSYIAEQGGEAFSIRDDEELREALVSTIEQLVVSLAKKLNATKNAEKSFIIDITVNEDTGFMQISNLDDSSKRTVAAIFSALAQAGVQDGTGQPINANFIRPYNINSGGNANANEALGKETFAGKEQLDTIVNAVENGKKVIIEPKSNKRKHY